MLIEHAGKRPVIDPTAWVAPDATLCGDMVLGPGTRVPHGARLIGEAGGAIRIGRNGIIMLAQQASERTRSQYLGQDARSKSQEL